MAQVDFSNAVLRPFDSRHPLGYAWTLGFANTGALYSTDGWSITTNHQLRTIAQTQSKISLLYTGQFTSSGTTFCISNYTVWQVTNVSFSAGDTYSFVVDVDTTLPT